MGRFAEVATNATTLSEIMNGKTKKKQKEIITQYNGVITITGFDILAGTKNGNSFKYPVLTIAEDVSIFFTGGAVLLKICEAWMEGFETCAACSEALAAEGGVKVKLTETTTKAGNNLTSVEVLV